MHERECKGYISFNRGVNELNRGVNELNRGVNELNRGVNHSVARQGCNLLRAAVTSAVTSQGCCCGNLQIHPLDLGHCDRLFLVFILFSCVLLQFILTLSLRHSYFFFNYFSFIMAYISVITWLSAITFNPHAICTP